MEKFKKLSKAEMKEVVGGLRNPVNYDCYCTGSSGTRFIGECSKADGSCCNPNEVLYCSDGE